MKDIGKKARFAWSFLRGRLVHVNLQILYACNYRCQICDFWKETYREKSWVTAQQAAVAAQETSA
jgi:MoaA/NifB/PqqE/SkfB family radical SAM enzyme